MDNAPVDVNIVRTRKTLGNKCSPATVTFLELKRRKTRQLQVLASVYRDVVVNSTSPVA